MLQIYAHNACYGQLFSLFPRGDPLFKPLGRHREHAQNTCLPHSGHNLTIIKGQIYEKPTEIPTNFYASLLCLSMDYPFMRPFRLVPINLYLRPLEVHFCAEKTCFIQINVLNLSTKIKVFLSKNEVLEIIGYETSSSKTYLQFTPICPDRGGVRASTARDDDPSPCRGGRVGERQCHDSRRRRAGRGNVF